jgi:signal transduction histidine kinase
MNRQAAELQIKNQQLEAFARTVAHDLKSPLNIVIGYADLLISDCEEQYPDNKDMINQLKTIIQSGEKMVSIIDALLLLARASKENINLQTVEMGTIVDQVVKHRLVDLLQQYNGSIVHKPDSWPTIQAYAPWLEEVWANYLSNGLKYGGRPPVLELGATEMDNAVRFWVKDNGEGLSPEAKEKLFTPFTRLHNNRAEGHGLGLSIVQQIIEQLGGEVGVDTELGKGSTFYFTLQREQA